MEKKRKFSNNTVSHDAPTASARFIYGSTTIHDGPALRFTTVELRMLTMRPRYDTVLVRLKPVEPQHPPRAVFLMNQSGSGLNRGVSDAPIHPECPRMATITPTVPLKMSPMPLR